MQAERWQQIEKLFYAALERTVGPRSAEARGRRRTRKDRQRSRRVRQSSGKVDREMRQPSGPVMKPMTIDRREP
jgi:hypothetical protein